MDEKPLGMVPLLGCRCRCGHEWLPREPEKPARVPAMQKPELGSAQAHPEIGSLAGFAGIWARMIGLLADYQNNQVKGDGNDAKRGGSDPESSSSSWPLGLVHIGEWPRRHPCPWQRSV